MIRSGLSIRVAFWVLFLFIVAACSSSNDSASGQVDQPSEITNPTISNPTQTNTLPDLKELRSIADLQRGDCFSFVEDRAAQDTAVWVVSCDVPHDGEVITELEYSGPTGESNSYAGEQAVREAAEAACIETFEPFVGIRWTLSTLELMTFWPSAQSWSTGDTEVVCTVVRNSAEPLLGSQQGTGI